MRGRDRFTADEIAQIRERLSRLRVAERQEQKSIRAGLRRLGFRISDWTTDNRGFTASDFDALLAAGRIVEDRRGAAQRRDVKPSGGTSPTKASSVVGAGSVDKQLPFALGALTRPRHKIQDALAGAVPDAPGLYAIYGPRDVWRRLGLGDPPDDRPLYVGKAEDSLVSRDLKTHFATGKTGRSSPRRSVAALLADVLPLVPMPRRPHDPERDKWSHYALEPGGDEALTRWMHRHLLIAVWPCQLPVPFRDIEQAVMQQWRPPLNLTGVQQPWKSQVREARDDMASAAKDWSPYP
jgi:hypothetical protein